MTLALSGGAVLTMDAQSRLIAQADIRIEGTDIAAIVDAGTGRKPDDEIIDCRDTLIIPGLVNTHTHAGTGIMRGLAEDKPREFWSAGYTLPGQDRYTPEDYAASARASCAEFLLNGVTCIADRFSHMETIGAAIETTGIRAVLGETIADARGPIDWRATEAVIEHWGTNPKSRVSAGLAPHALDTVSDELMSTCAQKAELLDCRVFIHVAQSELEIERVHARNHDGALACLQANGLRGSHVVAAHCIYLRDDEIEAWPESGISIAHCPASNIKIEARTTPLVRLIGKVAIGLGTDWAVSDNAMDMLAECRLAAMVGKLKADDPEALPIDAMLRLATIDGARVLGLDRHIGSIEPGKRADLVVIDLKHLPANPRHSLAANLLYSIDVSAVRDVLVDGAVLVRNRRLTRMDAEELARDLDRRARRAP